MGGQKEQAGVYDEVGGEREREQAKQGRCVHVFVCWVDMLN